MRSVLVLFLLFFNFILKSQENIYKIDAYFDLENKKININQNLRFFNNSNVELEYLILNDWANSYSTSKSPLGKRLSEEYSLKFQRSTKNQRGYTFIKKIYNENELNYSRIKDKIDLIKINLLKPLKPGDSISFNIDYQINLPNDNFTGYGISKSLNLNIRDWYFTFSLLKNDKWIMESNLDLNDLSHDFSFFKFNLTYPLSHILISDIEGKKSKTKTNKKFISFFEKRKNLNILLSKNTSFLKFIINDNIIITDIFKKVNKNDSLINNIFKYANNKTGNNIDFNDLDSSLIEKDSILSKTIKYVTKRLGPYPFKKIIISNQNISRRPIYGLNNFPKVISPFSQSFLYEFNFLKELLHTYLVESISLHNRKDYWEIEGIIIYLLMDYVKLYYPDLKLIGKYSELQILKNRNYSQYNFNEQYRLFENIVSSRNINQSIKTSLDSLTRINHKIINPYKAGMGLIMLSEYLTKEIVDNSIEEYFKNNRLKKEEQKITLEEIINKKTIKNTDWYFESFLTNKSFTDFSIKKVNEINGYSNFKLSNLYKSDLPIKLSFIKGSELIDQKWIKLLKKDSIISIKSSKYDYIELNKGKNINEVNYRNNLASFNNKTKPFKFILFNDFENIYRNQIYYMPLMGYNLYDGFMPGISLSNINPIKKVFSYKIKPLYSLKQGSVLGGAQLNYIKYYENRKLFSTQFFLGGSSFHYKENLSYTTFYPSILLTFRNPDLRSNYRQLINLRYISINKENNQNIEKNPNYNIFNIKYIITNSNGGKGFAFSSDLQVNNSFIKKSFTFNYRNYYKDNRQYNLRLFIGKFLNNSTKDDYFSFSTYRSRDYMFTYNLLGRSENTGFYSQQYTSSDAALKSKINPAYSNDWLIALNSGITIWQWIEGYYDFAMIKNKNINIKTVFDSGIRLNILTGYFELYFPFYSSLGNEFNQSNYLEKVRFKIAFDPQTLSKLITRRWF